MAEKLYRITAVEAPVSKGKASTTAKGKTVSKKEPEKEYSDIEKAQYYTKKANDALNAGDAKKSAWYAQRAAEFARKAK